MALFQRNILNKYLSAQNKEQIDAAYQRFCLYFHDEERQKNILASKEEQFQEGFLRELFVNVLGYTLNPDPDYNLITEKKDVNDARKADGAILQDGEVVGIIELKDHKTPDLSRVERQAFGYKNQHKRATYVIISNFQSLRFYIDNAVEFVEWDLFKMSDEEFSQMWLCLSRDCLMSDVPKRVKNESVSNEEQITNKLYKDYITFKRELFNNILTLNTTEEGEHSTNEWKILLFKKTQKLLDRLLFIFFAEDGGLLPPNSMRSIIEQWRTLLELDEEVSLYSRIKKYFGYMNTGYKGKKYEVYAYNGGLFKPDEVLDNLTIDDELLARHTLVLSDYDFQSDVDVNILGHIFENSLSEIEEVTAQLEDGKAPAVSKRKKDGVFYTPPYITKYIVENTVGRLCNEKKEELGINEQEYYSDEKRSMKEGKRMLDVLGVYREWLLQITICDPACGSGAFLNAALRFLMDEHHRLDEMEAAVTGSDFVFPGIENAILENNLYGVDINEESVEIARLALWLRTAKPYRKLSSLNANIKCGNSLISDAEVAGEKAFDWKKEFPQVFEKGGFDVVIGNPPYVRADSPGNSLEFRKYMTESKKWETLGGKWDLYIPFLELGIKISKTNGLCSFIIPDAYCHADYAKTSMNYMTDNKYLSMIDYFPGINVFNGVGVFSVIVNFDKNGVSLFTQRIHNESNDYVEDVMDNYPQSFRIDAKKSIKGRADCFMPLKNICYISVGIVGNSDEKNYKGEFEVGDLLSMQKDVIHCKLYYEGKNISRWRLMQKRYIEYGNDRSPVKWRRKGFTELFEGSAKIVTMRSPGKTPRSFIDTENGYFNESAIGFKRWIDLKGVSNNSISKAYETEEERLSFEEVSNNYDYRFLLAIMNSSLVKYNLNSDRRSNIHIYPEDWKEILIPRVTSEQQGSIISDVDALISSVDNFQTLRSRFLRRVTENLSIEKIPGALESFDELTFAEFQSELKKQKVRLTLAQQDEWEEYFNQYKQQCLDLRESISKTEKEIDNLVYDLYGLTDEERKIVEA